MYKATSSAEQDHGAATGKSDLSSFNPPLIKSAYGRYNVETAKTLQFALQHCSGAENTCNGIAFQSRYTYSAFAANSAMHELFNRLASSYLVPQPRCTRKAGRPRQTVSCFTIVVVLWQNLSCQDFTTVNTLRIGPPRGGHDRRHSACPHR